MKNNGFKIFGLLALLLLVISCTKNETTFSEKALNEQLITLDNQPITFQKILTKYKGKKVMLEVWASWCGDCIAGMPKVHQLQKEYPNISFVFLSVDKNFNSWQQGIKRFNVQGNHYFLPKGMKKGAFVDFLGLSWIPRYLVIDANGGIQVFNVTKATDKKIEEALKK